MKIHLLTLLLSAGVLLASRPVPAGEAPPTDLLAERLFAPDLILHNSEAIGLSEAQRKEIVSKVEKAQPRFEELQPAVVKERDALRALLGNDKAEEAAVLKQFDSMITRERGLQRAHLAFMLSLRNVLTVEQRTKLNELRKTHEPAAMEARLKGKVARVETAAQKLANNGVDPSAIAEQMQQFPELMRVGKVKAAEALLDIVLKELEEK